MKLRIRGNSIRLRLSQYDLERLADYGNVEESITFPDGRRFVYALESSTNVDGLTPDFEGDRLSVRMPLEWARTWSKTDRVGFERTTPLEGGDDLTILVEKDFKCLHKRPDDEDAFPHPVANQELVP